MAATTRLLYFLLVTLLCLVHFSQGIGDDISKMDTDLFLEDEGSGHGGGFEDDLEVSGSGNGEDDEDYKKAKAPAKPTLRPDVEHPYSRETDGESSNKGIPEDPIHIGHDPDIFNQKNPESQASFFSQPGILAAIICGAIVGLLCAILLVMFIVYRMRKKDEGSYVLDDSKRTPTSYGKTKEFFA